MVKNSIGVFFFYKSPYSTVSDCLAAVLPALNKNGLCLIQGSEYDALTKSFFVTTHLVHTSGEWMKSKIFVPIGQKWDAQAVGIATTYGRRYLLAAMCGLAQADDDANSISKLGGKPAGAIRNTPNMGVTSPKTVTANRKPQPATAGVNNAT